MGDEKTTSEERETVDGPTSQQCLRDVMVIVSYRTRLGAH
jgi:hypothetical protein